MFRTPIERLGSSERLAQGRIEERILALQERKAPLFTESDLAQLRTSPLRCGRVRGYNPTLTTKRAGNYRPVFFGR